MELPYEEYIQLAMIAWKECGGALSMRKAAQQHGVSKSTLSDHTQGLTSLKVWSQNQQRLSPGEVVVVVVVVVYSYAVPTYMRSCRLSS